MGYWVTRQNGFYDTELRIEIATERDEISPGMLSPNYEEEGEYETAAEAVANALQLLEHYPAETRPPITVSGAASIGVYPTSDSPYTEEALHEWAAYRDVNKEMGLDDE